MNVVVVTGSAGLVRSETCLYFGKLGFDVVGIDNDMRGAFFGVEASTAWNMQNLREVLQGASRHHDTDIRDSDGMLAIFQRYGSTTELVIHAAAQPSHEWAAREPLTDFDINAGGTLNLLEATPSPSMTSISIAFEQ